MESKIPIKVGMKDSSQTALIAKYCKEKVNQASTAWSILMHSISPKSLEELVTATRNPSEGWSDIKKLCAPHKEAKKPRVTQWWYNLRNRDGKTLTSIFGYVVCS